MHIQLLRICNADTPSAMYAGRGGGRDGRGGVGESIMTNQAVITDLNIVVFFCRAFVTISFSR